jgi:hypothetical protein
LPGQGGTADRHHERGAVGGQRAAHRVEDQTPRRRGDHLAQGGVAGGFGVLGGLPDLQEPQPAGEGAQQRHDEHPEDDEP